jgi:hypothetical protein
MVAELREFAGFELAEQRYISYALDLGLGRRDVFAARDGKGFDHPAMRRHHIAYQALAPTRAAIPEGHDIEGVERFFGQLVQLVAFDLGREQIESFSALRFLYERLLGARIRPWLPAAFCAASALPQIRPDRRKHLLQSLSETAATAPGWSEREPNFFPDLTDADVA